MVEFSFAMDEEWLALQMALAISLDDIRRNESKSQSISDGKDVSRNENCLNVTECVPAPSSEQVIPDSFPEHLETNKTMWIHGLEKIAYNRAFEFA